MNQAIALGLLRAGLDERLYSGATWAVARAGSVLTAGTIGYESFEPCARPITDETRFDVASLTKPVATATSILQLVERARLHLGQSLYKFFEPKYGPLPHLRDVDLRQLLTHTSGQPPIPTLTKDAKEDDIIRQTLLTPLLRLPGVGYTYSDTGYMLLATIVEQISGKRLDEWSRDEIFGPLLMTQTGFVPDEDEPIARTSFTVPPTVHDPRAAALGGVAGHAGLFSTASDLLSYAETIRTGNGTVLSNASRYRMATNQNPPGISGHSYGWFCGQNDYLPKGDLFSDASFGHTGFTGCALLIDPVYEVSLVLLTNRVLNESEDGTRFLRLRRFWLNAVAAMVTCSS